MRLIDADAFLAAWKAWMHDDENKRSFAEMVEGVPIVVDVAPVVHARWVHEQRYGDSGGWVWRCSACRREAISPLISVLKYCDSCGAKMDAKEE